MFLRNARKFLPVYMESYRDLIFVREVFTDFCVNVFQLITLCSTLMCASMYDWVSD